MNGNIPVLFVEGQNLAEAGPMKLGRDVYVASTIRLVVAPLMALVLAVPLQVTGLPQNLVVTGHPPDMVELGVRGKGKDLLKLKVQNARMVVDLSEVHPGHVQRMLSPADVELPVGSDVEVTGVEEPRMVSLTVDTLVTRTVDVRLSLVGDLPEHYVLDGVIRPDPPRVRLTGPAEELAGITMVSTEPLRLDELGGA